MKKLLWLSSLIVVTFSMCKKDKKNSPPSLTTNPISDLTSISAKTGGAITDDGGSAITKKGVCYATHQNPTVADSITNEGTGSASFVSDLTNLQANTSYYVRAYAINATGTSYGNEVTFKTQPGLAAISTTNASDIVALSAKSGGNVFNDGGTPVTERGIVYGTSQNPTTSNFKVVAGSGTGIFTATLSPLASQKTYYARAYAINASGTAYGNQIQFNSASANTVTDVDGNVYPYVKVCGKDWFASNLKTSKYRNGDAINDGTVSGFNWLTFTSGAYTYPNGKDSNNLAYGKLYNIEAVRDTRGVCPAGWHVATDEDWMAAEVCQGMDAAVAANYNSRCCGGLKLLEGGVSGLDIKKAGMQFVNQTTGATSFNAFQGSAFQWSSTVGIVGPQYNIYRILSNPGSPSTDHIFRQNVNRSYVMSVRCVRD